MVARSIANSTGRSCRAAIFLWQSRLLSWRARMCVFACRADAISSRSVYIQQVRREAREMDCMPLPRSSTVADIYLWFGTESRRGMLGCIQWLLPIIAATPIFDSKFDSADHPAPSLGSIQILHMSVRARLQTETKVQELCPSSWACLPSIKPFTAAARWRTLRAGSQQPMGYPAQQQRCPGLSLRLVGRHSQSHGIASAPQGNCPPCSHPTDSMPTN